VNKLLFLQKNLNLLEQIVKQSAKEAAATAIKRTMTAQSSCTTSYDNQEQLITTTVTKKFKMNEDDIVFCESDQENDEVDCF
jgi:hypothetical protein